MELCTIYLFYFHISYLGAFNGNGKHHIQYTSSDNLHVTSAKAYHASSSIPLPLNALWH